MGMKDRSKQLSKTTRRDPTRSLSRLAKVESKLVALFRNYRRRVLAEFKPAPQPFTQMEPVTQVQTPWYQQLTIDHFYQRLEDLTTQELIGPAIAILEKEIPDAFTHGTKYADLNIKAKMGIKLGAPLEERQRAWQKVGALVEKSKGEFKGVSDAVNQQIRRAVADGMVNEDSLSTVTKRIQEVAESVGENRARTIARTETMKAINTGVKDRYARMGIERVEFLAAEDERVCEICGELDGQIFDIDKAPEVPVHPNCLLPDTRCETPGGIISGLRVFYSGPVIETVLSNGVKITVTPNHMFLTDHGFAAADLLCEGDHILYCTGFKGVIPGDPNNNRQPPTIKEIIESLTESGRMTTATMPVSSKDLHGDGLFGKGNIDIVRPARFLRNNPETTRFQQVCADNFDAADAAGKRPLNRDRALALFLYRASLATDGGMSGIRQSDPFFRGRVRHTDKHGFASPPQSNAIVREALNDNGTSDAVLLSESFDGHSTLKQTDNLITIKGDERRSDLGAGLSQSLVNKMLRDTKSLSDLIGSHTGLIEILDVVAINVISYSGHVYDLQTYPTLYIGNGCIISNCRCTLVITEESLGLSEDEEEATQKETFEQITSGQGRFL